MLDGDRAGLAIGLYALVSILALPKIFAANAPAESLDELYQKARKEGK